MLRVRQLRKDDNTGTLPRDAIARPNHKSIPVRPTLNGGYLRHFTNAAAAPSKPLFRGRQNEKTWTENEISPTAINRTEPQRLFNILLCLMGACWRP